MTRYLTSLLLGLALAALPACGGDDDGGDGAGADAGSDDLPPAAEVCGDFQATCGFGGDFYADEAACVAAYDGYDIDRQGCVVEHWGFADAADDDSDDEASHCGHASGQAPCD